MLFLTSTIRLAYTKPKCCIKDLMSGLSDPKFCAKNVKWCSWESFASIYTEKILVL